MLKGVVEITVGDEVKVAKSLWLVGSLPDHGELGNSFLK